MGDSRFLVSLGSEISVKSKGTKRFFIEALWKHLGSRLEICGYTFKVSPFGGRFLVETSENALHILKSQFGLSKVLRFLLLRDTGDLSFVGNLVPERPFTYVVYVDAVVPPWSKDEVMSFKKGILRRLKELSEMALERWDNYPCERLELRIEAVNDGILVIYEQLEAPSGYPVGVGGRVLHLFSGGPDSVLSAILVARRGQSVTLLFFDDGVEGRYQKVFSAAQRVAYFMPGMEVELLVVPYRDILNEIARKVPSRAMCLFCKSTMLFIASEIAEKLRAVAISTGDILGEQASQTVFSMDFISRFSNKLLLRPLSGMCKEEIFELLRTFGVKEAFSMPSCNWAPKRPFSKPEETLLSRFDVRNFVDRYTVDSVRVRALP